jgi:outer membrane protein OmpA-like peptidoglycan-associated protein
MRLGFIATAVLLLLGLSACGGTGQSNATATASASAPVTTAPPSDTASAAAPAQAAGTPVAVPTPTPDPNLLSTANGTVLRSYSPAILDDMNDGSLGNAANGIGSELPAGAAPPYIFTFELAGVAKIAGFAVNLRGAPDKGPAPSLTIAVSTTGPSSGFTDVATFTRAPNGNPSPQPVSTTARWVRVTANQLYDSVSATGTLAPPPAKIDPTGIYIQDTHPDKNGALVMSGISAGDDRARFVAVGPSLSATECTKGNFTATYVGNFQGRAWTSASAGNGDRNPATVRGVINDEGTIIAGVGQFGDAVYFLRTSEQPAFCEPRVSGTGLHHVLVLDQDPIEPFYPADAPAPVAGYTFTAIAAGMLDASALQGVDTVLTRDVCYLPKLISPDQMQLLLQWVAAGHKLILSGGTCGDGADFTWLPYPFISKGHGPESTHAGLIQVENNALGTSDKYDTAHNVDVAPLVADGNNDLANTDLVTTTDPHWCGHYFIAKTTNLNGFVQTYAVDGRGFIIYDGFNGDDERPTGQRIRQLEFALPMPAGLPCSQLVTEAFLLEPSQEAAFAAGTAQSIRVPMEVLANQGWNGHVTLRTSGDLKATVTPSAFDIAGGTENIAVNIPVTASTKPGVYTVNVTADNGSGKTSSASATLTGMASLKKQFAPTQKRIRIYGIHFDVDSAHIQPRSESVIAQIAQIMRETPALRFQVEGHTDSDGGAVYNLGLSQRRAQAVVDDLVSRYKIARSRLVAKGYGLTKPVASNATDAGKALNRRVELLRL